MTIVGSAKSLVVRLVNPRFANFSKPLVLAIVVGTLTSVGFVLTFILDVSQKTTATACTDVTSLPQFVGDTQEQATFIDNELGGNKETSEEDGLTETTVRTEVTICLKSMMALTKDEQAEKVWGQLLVRAQICKPMHDWLLGKWPTYEGSVSGGGSGKTMWTDHGTPKRLICGHEGGVPEQGKVHAQGTYTLSSDMNHNGGYPWPGMGIWYDNSKKTVLDYVALNRWPNECPAPWNKYGQTLPVVGNYRKTVKTCTTTTISKAPGDAVGTGLAYAGYIELVVTAVVVVLLLGCGCLKEKLSDAEMVDHRIDRLERAVGLAKMEAKERSASDILKGQVSGVLGATAQDKIAGVGEEAPAEAQEGEQQQTADV